ncbi:3-hydroxyisobutyrate dehydrogenase, partial [Verminephrobacter sp. Larva24]
MSIAFIGLGHMGGPMALNLQRAGHAVQGFDLSPAARAQLAAAGLPIAADAAASVQGADIVISMLPANAH